MHIKTVMAIMVVSMAVLIFQPADGQTAQSGGTTGQPTIGQVNQAVGEAYIIKSEYQRRADEWTIRLGKLQELQAALSKAAPKGKEKAKAPVKPAVRTSQGVEKGK